MINEDEKKEHEETPKEKASKVLNSVVFQDSPETKYKKMLKKSGSKPSPLAMQDT